MQTHTTNRRRNRVFKSLHKPLTYLGVERTLFYFISVGAVGAFKPVQQSAGRCGSVSGRLRLRPLGDGERSGISAHPRQGRAVQTPL